MTSPADSKPAMRLWAAALCCMVFCSLLFEVIYNGCNWITTQRTDVGTWSFAWERHIPFVPVMIIPYWTLNLFFMSSFFVCRDRDELRVLTSRLATSIVVAGACFLLFPLRLVFPRPEVDGFLGLWFAALRSFDQPHNLAPSLHIALRTLVWPVFVPRTTGLVNLALRFWFLLVGMSTILVYQHQVMDIVTGWILAIGCLHLFARRDDSVDCTPRVRSARIGMYYGISACALVLVAFSLGGWFYVLLWPAAALAIGAMGYFRWGSVIFRKRDGRLPLSTRVLLGPILVGHWISLLYYARQCRAWTMVTPQVLIGRKLTRREMRRAIGQGVTAVLDLTAEFSETAPLLETNYLSIPILDLTAPTQQQLKLAADFIGRECRRGVVYVHCKIGYSRSAAAVSAFLLQTRQVRSPHEAFARLQSLRPTIVIRPEARTAVAEFAASLPAAGEPQDELRLPQLA